MMTAGDYTIEATTVDPYRTGHFTLTLSGTGVTSTATAPADPRFSDTCTAPVTGSGTISGRWASDCESTVRPGSYSRFYTFRVLEARPVNIVLRSGPTPMLYLRDGNDERAALWVGRANNENIPRPIARMFSEYPFHPGIYTIEATTRYPNEAGSFSLQLTGVDFMPAPRRIARPAGRLCPVMGPIRGHGPRVASRRSGPAVSRGTTPSPWPGGAP